jgi:Helix-turn-helix domain
MDTLARGAEPQSAKLTPEALGLTKVLYPVKEAHRILGIGRTKLHYVTKARKLPSVRIDGKVLYAAADLAAFINARREA